MSQTRRLAAILAADMAGVGLYRYAIRGGLFAGGNGNGTQWRSFDH